MEQRPFGKTDLRVSVIGFGAWGIGGDAYGPTDDEQSLHAIHRALDLGCTFFDTADVYGNGHSEELIGRALEGLAPAPVVATKAGWVPGSGWNRQDFSYPYLHSACTESLRRLRREVIDLFQLHNPPKEQLRSGEVFETLFRLKSEGLIRYGGISIHEPEEGLRALGAGIDSIQVVYHVLNHTAARGELFEQAHEAGVAIIAREPLANGFLTGKYSAGSRFGDGDVRAGWPEEHRKELARRVEPMKFLVKQGRTLAQAALKFILANEYVTTAIPGVKSVPQVEENFSAAAVEDLTVTELEQIFELTAGCGGD